MKNRVVEGRRAVAKRDAELAKSAVAPLPSLFPSAQLAKNMQSGYGPSTAAAQVATAGGPSSGAMMRSEAAASAASRLAETAHKTPPKGYPKDKGKFGDPANFKYPIDTQEHVRAALSYFSKPANHSMYSSAERSAIWGRIKAAAKRFGIEVTASSPTGQAKEHNVSKSIINVASVASIATPLTFGDLRKSVMSRDMGALLKADATSNFDVEGSGTGASAYADRPPPAATGGSTPMVEHERPGDAGGESSFERTASEVGSGEQLFAESADPMVDHPRPDASDGAPDPSLGMADAAFARAHGGYGMGGAYQGRIQGRRDEDEDREGSGPRAEKSTPAFADMPSSATPPEAGARDQYGMPLAPNYPETLLSADDQPMMEQLRVYTPHELERQAEGGGIAKAAHEAATRRARMLYDGGMGVPLGVGVRPRSADQSAPVDDSSSQARTWQQGVVLYSDGDDRQIEKAMARSDGLYSPTINFQSPLLKTRLCPGCRQNVPAMFNPCPDCGVEAGASYAAARAVAGSGGGAVLMEKSIRDAVRGPSVHEVYLPDGVIPL